VLDIQELNLKYKKCISQSINDITSLLRDIKSVHEFGWEGRRNCAQAIMALKAVVFNLKEKDSINNIDSNFYVIKPHFERKFKKIEKEIEDITNLLRNPQP